MLLEITHFISFNISGDLKTEVDPTLEMSHISNMSYAMKNIQRRLNINIINQQLPTNVS